MTSRGPDLRRAIAVLAALSASPAAAQELRLETSHRFFQETLPEELLLTRIRVPGTETGRTSRTAYQGRVALGLLARPWEPLGLRLTLDSGLIELGTEGARGNGVPLETHARETGFIGETTLELELGSSGFVQVAVGKRIVRLGDGAIFDGFVLGAAIDLDGQYLDEPLPFRLHLDAALPDATLTARNKRSPLLHARAAFVPGSGVEVWGLGVVFFDGDNALVPLLEDAVLPGLCRAVIAQLGAGSRCGDTRGTLGWAGAGASWFGEAVELRAQVLGGFGDVDAVIAPGRPRSRSGEIGFGGALATAEARWNVNERASVGGFGLFLSGDDARPELGTGQRFSGFMSLSPRLPYLTLFFNAGLGVTLQSPTVSSIAPDGAGLGGGGLEGEITLAEALRLRMVVAALASVRTPRTAGEHFIGVETDLQVEWRLGPGWSLRGEAAVFVPGRYYGEIGPAVQVFAGLVGRESWLP